MAIWKPEPSGCRENPGVFDVGGRIQSRYVSREVPGVTRVVTTSYPYCEPYHVAYEGPDGEPLTAEQAAQHMHPADRGRIPLEPEEWLVSSARATLSKSQAVWAGELDEEAAADLLERITEVRVERLSRTRLARVSPQAHGGWGPWAEGDPPRADAGRQLVCYDADGDPVALWVGGDVGVGAADPLAAIHDSLRGRIDRLRRRSLRHRQYRDEVAVRRQSYHPLYEAAVLAAGRNKGQLEEAERAYRCACDGYPESMAHWQHVLRRLAGAAA